MSKETNEPQEQKIVVNLPAEATGKAHELIIRNGDAQNVLDVKPPVKIALAGTITSVSEFITRRMDQQDQIPVKRCNVVVDREEIKISLTTNENDAYLAGSVVGQLKLHPKYEEFGINSSKRWHPNALGEFLKMNRSFFVDRESNMKLVTLLKNFQAKIDTTIEKEKSDNGSFKDNYFGVVSSNLPPAFTLKIPIFKGQSAQNIEVEFYAAVDGKDIGLTLVSPGANDILESLRDTVIDAEIAKIRELVKDIVIIEV